MFDLPIIETKRQWLRLKRYPIESLTGLIVVTLIFVGLYSGSKYLSGADHSVSGRLELVVAGYALWVTSSGLYGGPGTAVLEDAQAGILEQLFVSQYSFPFFLAIRALCGLAIHLGLMTVMLIAMCLITGAKLHLDMLEVVPFIGFLLASMGLGLAVAAYALLAKRTGSILVIGQFVLLAVIYTPIETFGAIGRWGAAFIPVNISAQLLQRQLAFNYHASFVEFAMALFNGVLYYLAGYMLLVLASNRARSLACIGQF